MELTLEQNAQLQHQLSIANDKVSRIEREKAMLEQKLNDMKEYMLDSERVRKEALENAKAAIFDAGAKLSRNLLDEHKKEAEAARETVNKQFTETTSKLYENFENITKTVSILKEQVNESRSTVDIVQKALFSPTGAGSLAEITLENLLKNSGLLDKKDYFMQYHTPGINQTLRPDAIVFLPGGNVIVIDSKASKFFMEIAAAITEEELEIATFKLKTSMRNHVKTLYNKDYKDAIKQLLDHKVNHISTIMFLPSESALEKLQQIDNEFILKAWEQNIFPAGPTGLVNILSHAKYQISQSEQNENYQAILSEVSSLMTNFVSLYDHARKVGSNIQSAMVNFDKFAGSFNSKILAKARKIISLGINLQGSKTLPTTLERYQIISSNKNSMIEIESENDEENLLTEE